MELARALGDPLRWRIVELLATEQLCVAHLAEELQTAQPLVSHHLKVLREAGLIEPDRYRYWTYYRLRPDALARLAATLGLLARSDPSPAACRRLIPAPILPHPNMTRARTARIGRPKKTSSPQPIAGQPGCGRPPGSRPAEGDVNCTAFLATARRPASGQGLRW